MNTSSFAKHRSMIFFLEKIIAYETLQTDVAKICEFSDFSWKISEFLRYEWLHFFHLGISRLVFLLVKTYGNVSCCIWFLATERWLAEIAKTCTFVCFDLITKSDFFRNNRLNFLHWGHSQQFCDCRASLNDDISGNVSHIGCFMKRNSWKMQFSCFWEKIFSSELLAAFSSPSGCQSTFLYSEKFTRLTYKSFGSSEQKAN